MTHPNLIEDAESFTADSSPNRMLEQIQASAQAISTLTAEVEGWKRIAGDFAGAAERCAEPPHYIVQPFLGLFKKYGAQLATLTKGSGS